MVLAWVVLKLSVANYDRLMINLVLKHAQHRIVIHSCGEVNVLWKPILRLVHVI